MEITERFQQFAKERNLQLNAAATLLAVSGGVDSMVMVALFRAAGYTFGIAHCNFQLRGSESEEDEVFVQKIASELGVPFYTKRFETMDYAAQNGFSTQMAARGLRYLWFDEIASSHGYQCVATAHNLNDSVETALFNFVRGTGISGMIGMGNTANETGISNSPILRPLLFATRDEIVQYAKDKHIAWREDSSNAKDDYARNFLRHQILPKMQEVNPNFLRTAERNLSRFRETKDNLDFLTRRFLGIDDAYFDQKNKGYSIDKQKLAQLPAPQRALREILKPQGFTEDQARQLAEKLDHVGFSLQSNSGWQVLCDRLEIIVRCLLPVDSGSDSVKSSAILIQATDLMVRLPDGTALFLMASEATPPFPDGSEAIVVDAAALQFPLTLRHWAEGDVFQPFGMGGQSQKLQDFFTNQKLSRIEKDQIWLLWNADGTLIWVLGLRVDERFRVLDATTNCLKFTWPPA